MSTLIMATLLLAGSLATFASAQSGLTPPQIGFVRDGAHTVRPLLGISGNFWMGEAIASGVDSAASSGRASMLKTKTGLHVLNALGHPVGRPFPAAGTVFFAFTPAGAPALAWLDAGFLLRWNGIRFERTVVTAAGLDGIVVSLAAPNSSTAAFIVQRDRDLWRVDISLMDGAVLFAAKLPGATAPALLFDDGTLLYTGKSALMLRAPQGEERAIVFSGSPTQFAPMGRDWVLIETGLPAAHFGLRVSTGALFELPEVEAAQ
jgi:hypothetical protein